MDWGIFPQTLCVDGQTDLDQTMAAADALFELLTIMVKHGPLSTAPEKWTGIGDQKETMI